MESVDRLHFTVRVPLYQCIVRTDPYSFLKRSSLERSHGRMQLLGTLDCHIDGILSTVGAHGMMESVAQSCGFILVLGPVSKEALGDHKRPLLENPCDASLT
jgi:hypothetical protein